MQAKARMTTKIRQLTNSRSPFWSPYWHGRAEEARAKASQIRVGNAREALLEPARMYDQMADLALAREGRKRTPKRSQASL